MKYKRTGRKMQGEERKEETSEGKGSMMELKKTVENSVFQGWLANVASCGSKSHFVCGFSEIMTTNRCPVIYD